MPLHGFCSFSVVLSFLLYIRRSPLYSPDTNLLPGIDVADIFSQFMACLFTFLFWCLLMVSFNFHVVRLINLSFYS